MNLTREQIYALEPGAETDALVATEVMGWHKGIYVSEIGGRRFEGSKEEWLDADENFICGLSTADSMYEKGTFEDEEDFHLLHWHPSSSIMWAKDVLDKMREEFPHIEIILDSNSEISWRCFLIPDTGPEIVGYDERLEMAICRAALLARMLKGK